MALKTTQKIIVYGLPACLLAWFLMLVFSGQIILSQSFRAGFLEIHYYGIVMALAVLAGFLYASKTAAKFGFTREQAENLSLWLIPIAFVFARGYHVASSWEYYLQHPADAFKVWQGGLSIYGAVVGGVFALVLARKFFKLKTSILNLLDWLAPAVLLGQVVGRFGNFFNYEAFGYPTSLPWKMFVPAAFRPAGFEAQAFYHPWFLYESLGNFLIFLALTRGFKSQKPGSLFFGYILLYNTLRFCLEFIRIDSVFIGSFRQNAVVSLGLVLIGAVGLAVSNKKQNVPIP